MTVEELADVIKNNPGCYAVVDNDDWALFEEGWGYGSEDCHLGMLAEAGDMEWSGGGYGSGNCYGGDILQALALIVGIKVESV
jgi:hypothetical protein